MPHDNNISWLVQKPYAPRRWFYPASQQWFVDAPPSIAFACLCELCTLEDERA
jgi:hypothetical protein